MKASYRDEARVEHMHRAIQQIRRRLSKVEAATFQEGNDDVELIL